MKRLSTTSAMSAGVAMQRSCREGGSGAMTGLARGSSMGEDGAALGILAQAGGDGLVETVETAAHVAGLHSDEDFQTAGEAQHGDDE